jgi:hypothetical protein
LVTSCNKEPRWFDTEVELTRLDIVRRDDKGRPITEDVEFSYFGCPGKQLEVIRGGTEFAQCMDRYKVGDKVPIKIERHWLKEGHWDWTVHMMGICTRPPDDEDEASFDTVQECEDLVVHGAKVGFRCNRLPQKQLLQKCPWFGR